MPVLHTFSAPASAKLLDLPSSPDSKLFIAYISSTDPTTQQYWCPDVRRILPHITATFAAHDGPDLALVEVGQKPEWRDSKNVFRVNWNVNNVPTLVRYQRVDGEVRETGRLVEDEILDKEKISDLFGKTA